MAIPDITGYVVGLHSDAEGLRVLGDRSRAVALNRDGSVYFDGVHLVNVVSGTKRPVLGPGLMVAGIPILSPDGTYLIRRVGVFPSGRMEEGQWGLWVNTPDAAFFIASEKSFFPLSVDDRGRIVDERGFVFELEGLSYLWLFVEVSG